MDSTLSSAFPRSRRVVKTDEFSSVFSLRPVYRTPHFVLYARPNTLTQARLGVVAAKRLAPRAITRNTVKRMTREQFRQTPMSALDCIVRLSKPVNTKAGPGTNAGLRRLLKAELVQLFAAPRLHEQPTIATVSSPLPVTELPAGAPSALDVPSGLTASSSLDSPNVPGAPGMPAAPDATVPKAAGRLEPGP